MAMSLPDLEPRRRTSIQVTSIRRLILRTSALVCALVLAVTASATAAVLDGDFAGGVKVGDRPALRAVSADLYIPAGVLATMDGRELWARDPEAKRAMASTTKIMTAVVVLENAELDDVVTVDRVASKVGESAMNIRPGEHFTVRQLLAGVLVQSGNDAATMLAEHVSGSVDEFVNMMNAKAKQLDMVNTHFKNPHGLDVPGHYTSAEDLTTISRYAMRIPEFRRLVGTYTMKVRSDRYTHILQNHNALLKSYKGAEGIKTGWTDEAGYCVVFAAKRGGIEFVGCVMGAASEAGRAQQAKKLLDWGFAHYKLTSVVATDEPVGRVRVSDYIERTTPAVTAEATSMPVFDLAGPVGRRIELKPSVEAPVKRGDNLGKMTIYQGDTILAQVPIVSAADIPGPTVWQRIGFFFIRTWRGIVGT